MQFVVIHNNIKLLSTAKEVQLEQATKKRGKMSRVLELVQK